jgi:hypothetical protein
MGRPFFRKRGEGGGGSPALGIFIVAISFVFAILAYRLFPIGGLKTGGASLAPFASRLGPGYRPLRIEILEAGPSSTRLRLEFLDLSGKELSILERSVPGGGLTLGFWLMPTDKGKGEGGPCLVFPRRLPADGSLLYEAYSVSGFPGIFGGLPSGPGSGAPLSEAERSSLSAVFSALVRADASKARPSGSAAGRCYDVWVSIAGRVSVRPCQSF